jgi:hypothetical protein
MQSAVSDSAAFSIGEQWGRGNDGSHRPGVHRPRKWKTQTQTSHFPTGARDNDDRPICYVKSKTRERKAAATRPPHSSAPISCSSFKLENAPWSSVSDYTNSQLRRTRGIAEDPLAPLIAAASLSRVTAMGTLPSIPRRYGPTGRESIRENRMWCISGIDTLAVRRHSSPVPIGNPIGRRS